MNSRFYYCSISVLLYCSIYSGVAASNNESAKYKKRESKNWSTEEEEKLIFFDALTDDGRMDQFERIKSYWHDEYPNSNVTDSALYHKLYRLRKESQEKGEHRMYFKWNEERDRELLNVHRNTYPYKRNATVKLEVEWKRRYENYQFTRHGLKSQVRKIFSMKKKDPGYAEKDTSHRDSEQYNQQDSDLMHAYRIVQLDGGLHWRKTYEMWTNLHPQFSHVSLQQLKERINHLRNNPPNEYFPWTEGEDEELLEIYHKTMPDKGDQGKRIYDIWSKIHPRYKFMTPDYLQIHASTLAHKRDVLEDGRRPRRKWTDEERADLADTYRQNLGSSGFHKAWIRKHPRLAFHSNRYLKKKARGLENQGIDSALRETDEESSHQRENNCASEDEEEMHIEYGESSSKNCEHAKRLMNRYDRELEAYTPMKFGSMKKLTGRLKEGRSEKPHGKAQVVYHSDEQESSTSNMSEDSE